MLRKNGKQKRFLQQLVPKVLFVGVLGCASSEKLDCSERDSQDAEARCH
jgi:hypothetical protein